MKRGPSQNNKIGEPSKCGSTEGCKLIFDRSDEQGLERVLQARSLWKSLRKDEMNVIFSDTQACKD